MRARIGVAVAVASLAACGALVAGCADLLGFQSFTQQATDGGATIDGGITGEGGAGPSSEDCSGGCGRGRKCDNGACVCDPATCAGCCSGTACSTSWPGCGTGGGACTACDGRSDRCDANGACVCGGRAACDPGQHCSAGACVCDATSCSGTCCGTTCVAVDQDGANCGACGHSCLGAACSGGLCAPEPIATKGTPGYAIQVVNGQIYWLSGSGLYVCPTSGCPGGPSGPFATGYSFGENDRLGFWNDATAPRVFASGLDTSQNATWALTTKPDGSSPTGYHGVDHSSWLMSSDGYFYWFAGSASALQRKPVTNGVIVNIITGVPTGLSVATDDQNVYLGSSISLLACPRATFQCGDTPTTIATNVSPQFLATTTDSSAIYFAWAKGIYRCSYRGCTDPANPPIWIGGQSQLAGLASDATAVYWTDKTAGTVMKCPHGDTCAQAIPVAKGLVSPDGIALDAQYVYVTLEPAGNGPSVVRIAK